MDIKKYVYNNHWTIGFSVDSIMDIVNGKSPSIHWMNNPYKNRWFADPFILDVTDDDIIVLVEEYYDPIQRGRISKLMVDKVTYKLKSIDVVLELSSHLSFPAIKRIGNDIFIYPENGAFDKLLLYKYNSVINECMLIKTLSIGCLADAIITDVFGDELMFTTLVPNHNGKDLLVYMEDGKLFQEYKQIHFDTKVARNAGDWFTLNGKVYRPAQDCSERYGGAVVLQEVTKDGDSYSFKTVNRLESTHSSYQLGCHTFNHYKGISVIDVNGYRRPLLAKSIGAIMRVVRRLFNAQNLCL